MNKHPYIDKNLHYTELSNCMFFKKIIVAMIKFYGKDGKLNVPWSYIDDVELGEGFSFDHLDTVDPNNTEKDNLIQLAANTGWKPGTDDCGYDDFGDDCLFSLEGEEQEEPTRHLTIVK